jgi:hypothetical protein
MVVNDVGAPNEAANQRRILANIGVFKSMDHAGDEFSREDGADEFQN